MKPAEKPCTLVGIVERVGGARTRGKWTLIVFINPWKEENEDGIRTDSLRLASERPIREEEIQEARERYQYEKKAWRFSVVHHANWIELLEIGEMVEDSELLLRSDENEKPRILKDEVLGGLVFDRRLNWFEGNWLFKGQRCVLYINPSGLGNAEDLLKAREPLLRLAEQVAQIEDALATMVDLYNGTWRQGSGLLSREAFLQKTAITSITVQPNGLVCLDFDAEDLFLDHAIEVRIEDNGETITANLA